MGGACSTNGGEEECIYNIVGKPEGKRPLRRPRRRLVDNIKMNLREIGWDAVDWIDMVQVKDQWKTLTDTLLNLRVP
jgi:ribosome biogenesis protein Nip4